MNDFTIFVLIVFGPPLLLIFISGINGLRKKYVRKAEESKE